MARFSKIGGVVAAGALLASSTVAVAQPPAPAMQANSLFRLVNAQVSVFLPMISISCLSNQAGCVLPLDADRAVGAAADSGFKTPAEAAAAAEEGESDLIGALLLPALLVGGGGIAAAASGGETASRGT